MTDLPRNDARLRQIRDRLAAAQASNVYRGDYRSDMAYLVGLIDSNRTVAPLAAEPVLPDDYVEPPDDVEPPDNPQPLPQCSICGDPVERGNICDDCAVCACGSGKPPMLCHGQSRREALKRKSSRVRRGRAVSPEAPHA